MHVAHSGYPELGISANDKLIDLLSKLKALVSEYFSLQLLSLSASMSSHCVLAIPLAQVCMTHQDLFISLLLQDLPEDRYFGKTTMNIGLIQGGLAANIVPAFATAGISFRIATSTKDVLALVDKVIPHEQQVKDKITIERITCWEPVRCHPVPGFETFVANYFTDIPSFLTAKHSLLFGPGSILCAHAPHEYINKKELIAAVGSYKDIVLKVLAESRT